MLTHKIVSKLLGKEIRIRILIFFPSRISDPGIKKVPDPRSGSTTLVFCLLLDGTGTVDTFTSVFKIWSHKEVTELWRSRISLIFLRDNRRIRIRTNNYESGIPKTHGSVGSGSGTGTLTSAYTILTTGIYSTVVLLLTPYKQLGSIAHWTEPVFRFRINLIRIQIQHFRLIRIQSGSRVLMTKF